MKTRRSFLVRWLHAIDPEQRETSIIDVEHVQSGETWRFSSIEEAAEKMKVIVRAPLPAESRDERPHPDDVITV